MLTKTFWANSLLGGSRSGWWSLHLSDDETQKPEKPNQTADRRERQGCRRNQRGGTNFSGLMCRTKDCLSRQDQALWLLSYARRTLPFRYNPSTTCASCELPSHRGHGCHRGIGRGEVLRLTPRFWELLRARPLAPRHRSAVFKRHAMHYTMQLRSAYILIRRDPENP